MAPRLASAAGWRVFADAWGRWCSCGGSSRRNGRGRRWRRQVDRGRAYAHARTGARELGRWDRLLACATSRGRPADDPLRPARLAWKRGGLPPCACGRRRHRWQPTLLRDTECFSTEESLTLDARPAGLWTVAVLRPLANCESGGILNVRCSSDVSYHLTAYVKHRTRVTVDAPNIARRNARFVVRGRLEGVRGSVLLEGSWNGSKWSTVGVVRTSSTGAYQMPLRLKAAGRSGFARRTPRRRIMSEALP